MHMMPILLLRHEFVEQTVVGKNNGYSIIKDILCIHRKLQLGELYHMQEKGKPMDRKIVNNVFINYIATFKLALFYPK